MENFTGLLMVGALAVMVSVLRDIKIELYDMNSAIAVNSVMHK